MRILREYFRARTAKETTEEQSSQKPGVVSDRGTPIQRRVVHLLSEDSEPLKNSVATNTFNS